MSEMKKNLLNQIRNEWRSNTLLVIELFIVSVIMWYLVDYCYINFVTITQPQGCDISNTYRISVGRLSDGQVGYDPSDSVSQFSKNILELASRLKQNPDIEYVSLSEAAYPFSGSCVMSYAYADTLQSASAYIRTVYPGYDFFSVFRIKGTRGESSQQLDKMFDGNHCIISDNLFDHAVSIHNNRNESHQTTTNGYANINDDSKSVNTITRKGSSFIGRLVKANRDSSIVATSIIYPKRSNLEDRRNFRTVYKPGKIDRLNKSSEICIRVRPDRDHDFKDKFWKESQLRYKIGNLYVSNIRSIEEDRKMMNMEDVKTFQQYAMGMAFLLINIFLGLLGTFWFRTQQRTAHIALMKALGATNRNVIDRQISEGMILLAIAMLPAIIVAWNIARAELIPALNGEYLYASRFILTIFFTWLIMALTILLGCWMPIKKAIKVEPATALHED